MLKGSPPILAIILHVNGLDFTFKKEGIEKNTFQKKMIQLYAVYKRLTLYPKTQLSSY